jgi:glycerol kinase
VSTRYILSLDQGTTSSRAILFNDQGQPVCQVNQEYPQHFPQPGWVEHDARDILNSQMAVLRQVVAQAAVDPADIAAVGITNQRETVLVWDRNTGEPIYNAIVWQCRRTADICEQLMAEGWVEPIRERTGLIIDAYFSGTKIKWILDHVPGARERAERGELIFGTIDTWLIWNLTGGKCHVTDYSNASRTMLFNIHKLTWDSDILARLGIPESMLPTVVDSSGVVGEMDPAILGAPIPIAGIAGDQQAALFGQCCFEVGDAKNTYGTGCFLLMNTGDAPVKSQNNLLSTIAWGIGGKVQYCLEGSIFVGGAVMQWLRDELGLIQSAAESEQLALSVADTAGVYLVPAFAGLGAPYWDMYSRGIMVGLTRGANRAHIVRAALESIAYQSRDVLAAMQADVGVTMRALKVDGGACANNFLMQFQTDMMGTPVYRPHIIETTALGAAYLAGLAVGVWQDTKQIAARWLPDRAFFPEQDDAWRAAHQHQWLRAVERAKGWIEVDEHKRRL